MKLRSVQRTIWANKRAKGFNTTDVPLELCLLQGEVTELFQAWRRKLDTVNEELADVAIYVLSLAEMLGVDLEQEIAKKVAVNQRRQYRRINGALVKVSDGRTPNADSERKSAGDDSAQAQLLLFPATQQTAGGA